MTGHRKVIIMEMAHEELYNKLKGKEYIRFIQRKPGRFSPKSTMIYRRRDPKLRKLITELKNIMKGKKEECKYVIDIFSQIPSPRDAQNILTMLNEMELLKY